MNFPETSPDSDKTEQPEEFKPGRPEAKAEGLAPVPLAEVKPVVRADGLGAQMMALARYMARTEVHTYAFSVAANSILSLFPFIVLLLTISRLLRAHGVDTVMGEVVKAFLPVGQEFVLRNMEVVAHPHKGTQLFSLVMLLITSTGVFLPLEVALNNVWGVTRNRNYVHNQIVSLGLAFAVGILALASAASTAAQQEILSWVLFGHTNNMVFHGVSFVFLKLCSGLSSILLFFLVYWVLPNRKVPARAALPTAIVVGLLWEVGKSLYIRALPWLDFQSVYGPFYISVGLMTWAFLSGLLLLAGAHFSATRYTLRLARESEMEAAKNDA